VVGDVQAVGTTFYGFYGDFGCLDSFQDDWKTRTGLDLIKDIPLLRVSDQLSSINGQFSPCSGVSMQMHCSSVSQG
jgi:hypothetical protein